MKNYLCLIIVTMLPFGLTAQIGSYDLSDYKLPEIKRHQLDLKLGLGNNNRNTVYEFDSLTNSKNVGFNDRISASYSFYQNSPKFQMSQNVDIYHNGEYHFNENNSKTKSTRNEVYLGLSSNNRFYIKNLYFAQLDLTVNNRMSKSESLNLSENRKEETLRTDNTFYLRMPVYFGKGRIEPVQDARLAVYILEDLAKTKRLKKEPSPEEIEAMAKEISKVLNERVLDSRLHKIKEIEVIDSFLVNNGFVSQQDAKYFTRLNDNWDYANGPARNSGSRISVGLAPYLRLRNYEYRFLEDFQDINHKDTTKTETIENEASIGPTVAYSYSKPLNLYWQLTGESSISYSIKYFGPEKDDAFSNLQDVFHANLALSLGYFPNSRTSVRFSPSINYNKPMNWIADDDPDRNDFYLNTTISEQIRFDYYISPHLLLSGNFNLNYHISPKQEQESLKGERRLYSNAGLNLAYKIF